ncbi:MAG TPA: M48 family metallopeptidase [Ktedonobacteraceae bacterium]|jgi:STE24 endopeptidase|nr:M48 family metallopeptidase [Ktedonobacteraceae bacterium]
MDIQLEQHAEIDAERQRKAKEYARIRRRLSLVNMAMGAAGVIILLATNLNSWLRNLLQPLGWQPVAGWFPWQVLVYFLILMLVYEMLTAPLVYYNGFVLPHRYGLSTMKLGDWLGDLFKGLLLGLALEGLVIELVYALLAFQPASWWLWVAIVMLFFTVIMANLAPVLILPLFYKFTPLPEGDLTKRLLALATRAHTRVRGVFTMHMSNKTTAANAALMGLGNTRRIVIGDTMLDRYTPDEIEVVLAHELGHHVHRDIWKLIISQSILTLGGLCIVNLILHWAVNTRHYYPALADASTIPLLLALIGAYGLVIMPIGNAISRLIEYQADEYALQSTGMVEAFKGAMKRLANQNLSDVEPSPIIEFLFHDHPSVGKRLKHADEFEARGKCVIP